MLSAQLLRLHERAALNGSADTSRQSPRWVVPEIGWSLKFPSCKDSLHRFRKAPRKAKKLAFLVS
jgi:hypothetical protein